MKVSKSIPYENAREAEYLPSGDQFDLIVKTFAHLDAQGVDIGPHGKELIQSSHLVKAKFPKK